MQRDITRRFVVHIGQSKTGTTAIEHFFCAHRGRLAGEGILYPTVGIRGRAHHGLAASFRAGPQAAKWMRKHRPEALRRDILKEAQDFQAHTVLLSSEMLFPLEEPGLLKSLLDGLDVSVIVLLRRQDRWADSMYQHQLKMERARKAPREWLESRADLLDYESRVARWTDAFGERAIRLGVFEPASLRDGLLTYFCRLAGIAPALDLADAPARNERLSRDALEYLLQGGHKARDAAARRALLRALEEYSRVNPDPVHWRSFFSPKERFELLDRYAAGNAALARRFLGRADGVLFEDMAVETEYEVYPGLSTQARKRIEEFLAAYRSGQAERDGRQIAAQERSDV